MSSTLHTSVSGISESRFYTVTIRTLQQIINITWTNGSYDIARLSRWIRCLFALALTTNGELADQLFDQFAKILEKARRVSVISGVSWIKLLTVVVSGG